MRLSKQNVEYQENSFSHVKESQEVENVNSHYQ